MCNEATLVAVQRAVAQEVRYAKVMWKNRPATVAGRLDAATYVIVPAETGAGVDTCIGNRGWCSFGPADKWAIWTQHNNLTRTLERAGSPVSGSGVRTFTMDGEEYKCMSMLRIDEKEVMSLMDDEAPMATVTFDAPVALVKQAGTTHFVDVHGVEVARLRPIATTWRIWLALALRKWEKDDV
jgi:hypothetical protein